MENTNTAERKLETPSSALINLACNIVIPVFILNKFTERLGALEALGLALAFPLGFFFYEYIQNKKVNWISVLGFVNTLLTGGFAVLQLGGKWFALKEAGFPLLIGVFVYLSSFYGKRPFVETLILNPNVFKMDLVEKALEQNQSKKRFFMHMRKTNTYLSYSFLLSAILNFVLAYIIFKDIDPLLSETQRAVILNEQISKMTWMGYIVILLPSMLCLFLIFQYLAKGIYKHTGLQLMDLMHKN